MVQLDKQIIELQEKAKDFEVRISKLEAEEVREENEGTIKPKVKK